MTPGSETQWHLLSTSSVGPLVVSIVGAYLPLYGSVRAVPVMFQLQRGRAGVDEYASSADLLALLFLFAATSYAWPSAEFPTLEVRTHGGGNYTSSNGYERALNKWCKKMRILNSLSQVASKQTKLDAWVAEGKLDTAEVDAIKAKAANATAELQTMQSNTTLVSECAVVNAEHKSVKQCKQMKNLTKLAALAGNETAMAAYEQIMSPNETDIEKLKAKIAEASTKLQEMQSNTRLTDFCTQRQQQKDNVSNLDDATAVQVQQAISGAAGLTAQTMARISVPALATILTLFL